MEGPRAGDSQIGSQMRSRDERFELDRCIGDSGYVFLEEGLDLFVSGDPPEWSGGADIVVAEGIRLATVLAVVVLSGAEGADGESGGDFGRG